MNYIGRGPAPDGVILVGDTNPIGMVAWQHAVPDGSWLHLNGQIVSKVTYADLWAWAQGFLTADQVANPGLYRSVDANTFALPKLDGLFIRAAGQVDVDHVAAALGVQQADATALPIAGRAINAGFIISRSSGGTHQFDAGTIRGNLAGDPETRPVNVALVPCVKALRTILLPTQTLPPSRVQLPEVALAGAFVDIATALPATVRRITVMLHQASINGAGQIGLQLGTAGGIDVAGYVGAASVVSGAAVSGSGNFATFFDLTGSALAAASTVQGRLNLDLADVATNRWAYSGNLGYGNAPASANGGGSKILAGPLTTLRLIASAGVLDQGLASVSYQ